MGEVPVNKVNRGNKGVSVLQWNANGLHSMGYGAELVQLISTSNKPGIICIQETWLGTGSNKNKKSLFFLRYQVTPSIWQIGQTALEVD